MAEEYTLPRAGDVPVTFAGELIAEESSFEHQGPSQNRWFDLTLYRTTGGAWVVGINYRTRWQGERDQDAVTVCPDAAAVRAAVTGFDPCDPALWQGIPAAVHDAEKRNATLRTGITNDYRAAAGRLLNRPEFAERID